MLKTRFCHSASEDTETKEPKGPKLKGPNSVRYYGSTNWNLVHEEIRYTDSLEKLKK